MRDDKKRPGSVAAPLRAEDKRGICETTLSTAQSTTAAPGGQRRIADFLSREMAKDVVCITAKGKRRAGVPILADGRGYFLPASEEERAECVRSMRHRAGEILTTARAVERGKIEYEEGLRWRNGPAL